MPDYTYNVIGNKEIEIWYKNKRKLKFRLKQKRSFTVLQKLIDSYPSYLNIHDLDNVFNDPNKAFSELKITDGFKNFISEKKIKKNVKTAKIELDRIFNQFHPPDSNVFITLYSQNARSSLSEIDKQKLFKDFKGRCNITHVPLLYTRPAHNLFMKIYQIASYDHRIPLSKGGEDSLENMQLVSEAVNLEKMRICNSCLNVKCEECALAYPEDYDVIQANQQNIKNLKL